MLDVVPDTAYRRGILAGAGRFCAERGDVRLNHISVEWVLTGDLKKVDGVITIFPNPDSAAPATRFGCPVVNVSCVLEEVPYPTVTVDNSAVGYLAAEHLLLQGYAHFACHLDSRVFSSRARSDAFRKRLQEVNRDCAWFDTAAEDCRDQPPERLRQMTTRWLQDLPKPFGLFAHNDTRAATLIEICDDAQIAIPEEAGVIGTDNDSMLQMTLRPTLSSVDPAADIIGYRAAELLLNIVEGGKPPARPILIPPRGVIQRESTATAFLDDDLLGMAIGFIREHATKPIEVSDVLDNVPISRRSLERRFRERLGRSPADEIRRVQMDHAKRLLLDSEQKPATIGRAVGYKRFRSFAAAFRREVGMTPMQYARAFMAK